MKPRTIFRRPPLSDEQYADITSKREANVTWLELSQQYGMTAEALSRRYEQRKVRGVVERVGKYS